MSRNMEKTKNDFYPLGRERDMDNTSELVLSNGSCSKHVGKTIYGFDGNVGTSALGKAIRTEKLYLNLQYFTNAWNMWQCVRQAFVPKIWSLIHGQFNVICP